MKKKIKVLLVGETWFVLKMHIKGFDMVPLGGYEDFGVWFMKAMSQFSDIKAVHMPNHMALTLFPQKMNDINQYDVIILSDCGKNTLLLYPQMFTVPMGPDRLELIKEYVANGGSFIMIGGWNSFQGIRGISGYHGTVIEEILPVEIQESDDRIEKPQGVTPTIIEKDHPIFNNLSEKWPMFLGYNKVKVKSNGKLLATLDNNPFIVVGEYKKGRTMAFTSDLSKHWGTDFILWNGYANFWHNVLTWLPCK